MGSFIFEVQIVWIECGPVATILKLVLGLIDSFICRIPPAAKTFGG